jgi:hypothetical protein
MIKGAVIRETLAWYTARYGAERVRSFVRGLPPDLARYLDPDDPFVTFLGASWYPAPLVHSMLEAVAQEIGEAEIGKHAREATRDAASRKMGSVYRFLFDKLASPEMYALSVPRLWRTLHTTGDRRVRVVRPGEAESTVERWAGHHPILCTMAIETMCGVFEVMGCQRVTYERTSCVSRGDGRCFTRVRWQSGRT